VTHARYEMFAAYNRWANQRLYAAAAGLSDAEYRADRGVFFRSMHGTLNHLVATDRIWLRRFTGEGEAPDRLDAIVADDFATLSAVREQEDARFVAFVAGLSEATLAGRFRYRPLVEPRTLELDFAAVLDHVFNHQTHHRGQAHAILTGLGREAPALDLLYFWREAGLGGIKVLD
jgi:uncharacterized damage-inducible protein DinB